MRNWHAFMNSVWNSLVGRTETLASLDNPLEEHDFLHPMARLPTWQDGDICKIGARALSIFSRRNEGRPRLCHRKGRRYKLTCAHREKLRGSGIAAEHDQEELAHAPPTRQGELCCDSKPKCKRTTFRVRPGVGNFQLR